MSGPVTTADAEPTEGRADDAAGPTVTLVPSRSSDVAGTAVRRALPTRGRRTVGPWCFVDHLGPAGGPGRPDLQIGPHPHIGLQTVTWLLDGAVLHRDSLGSEQLIRPGQLNLMTAGQGVSHAEESPPPGGRSLHGAQLWVAQPETTRHGEPAFEHHAELPVVELGGLVATVLLGELAAARSPARADTPIVGADLALASGSAAVPLESAFEHALVALDGALAVGDEVVRPGALAYLGEGRESLDLRAVEPCRALLLGGPPFGEQLLMWWNFVARTREEIARARADWEAGHERFGEVGSPLARIPAPQPTWRPASA